MKQFNISRCDTLDSLSLQKVGEWLELNAPKIILDSVNWPEVAPYQPLASVAMCYSASHLYLHFFVHSHDLRAVNTQPLSPVADDSCMEFFMQLPDNPEYWNFEFNCIGTVNASHRIERPKPTRLTPQEIESIGRYASCGTEPFEEKRGIYNWTLTVSIPFTLIGLGIAHLPESIRANFYCCGAKTSHPHFLSWNPIGLEKPNFHAPQFFGKLNLI